MGVKDGPATHSFFRNKRPWKIRFPHAARLTVMADGIARRSDIPNGIGHTSLALAEAEYPAG